MGNASPATSLLLTDPFKIYFIDESIYLNMNVCRMCAEFSTLLSTVRSHQSLYTYFIPTENLLVACPNSLKFIRSVLYIGT